MRSKPASAQNPASPKTETLAYSYVRFSDKRQAAGDSVNRQRSKARAYASAHNLHLVEIPVDEGISAHHGKNSLTGNLADFIAKVRAGEIPAGSTLLVENLDRLSRERIARAASMLLELVEDCGIRVITLHNTKTYQQPMTLVDAIQALLEIDLAYQESAKKSERVKAAWQRARESGRILHNPNLAPGWLKKTPDGWECIPEKVAVVQRIFEFLAARNGAGMYQLAGILNQEGVSPLNANSAASGWHSSAIDKLRCARAVLGEYSPGVVDFVNGRRVRRAVETRQGYFPAIIDESLWQRAQRPGNTRTPGRPSLTTKNLFRGLLWSEVDGTKMIHRDGCEKTKDGTGISYLVSGATLMKRSHHRIRYERFEDRMVFFLRSLKPDLFATRSKTCECAGMAEKTLLQAKLAKARRAHENLTKAIEIADDLTELVTRIRETKAEIAALQTRLNNLSAFSAPGLIAAHDLKTPDGRDKARHEIAALVERIWVSADGAHVRVQAPRWLDGLNADLVEGTFDFVGVEDNCSAA